MTALSLFAIIPADAALPARMPMDGAAPPGLRVLAAGPFAAVIADTPPEIASGRSRSELAPWLLTHQRVIEAVMAATPVLPVKFGTSLRDESAALRILTLGRTLFAQAFNALASRIEMNLTVRWDVEQVLSDIVRNDPALIHAGATEPSRETLGRMVAQAFHRRRDEVAAHIVAKLRPLIHDRVILPSTATDIVLDIALLIERTAEDPLGQQPETLDDEFSDMLSFRLVGPLPPLQLRHGTGPLSPAGRDRTGPSYPQSGGNSHPG